MGRQTRLVDWQNGDSFIITRGAKPSFEPIFWANENAAKELPLGTILLVANTDEPTTFYLGSYCEVTDPESEIKARGICYHDELTDNLMVDQLPEWLRDCPITGTVYKLP